MIRSEEAKKRYVQKDIKNKDKDKDKDGKDDRRASAKVIQK